MHNYFGLIIFTIIVIARIVQSISSAAKNSGQQMRPGAPPPRPGAPPTFGAPPPVAGRPTAYPPTYPPLSTGVQRPLEGAQPDWRVQGQPPGYGPRPPEPAATYGQRPNQPPQYGYGAPGPQQQPQPGYPPPAQYGGYVQQPANPQVPIPTAQYGGYAQQLAAAQPRPQQRPQPAAAPAQPQQVSTLAESEAPQAAPSPPSFGDVLKSQPPLISAIIMQEVLSPPRSRRR